MLKKGKLTARLMEKLGHIVAKVHLQAATNDYIRSFGDADRIKEAIAKH